MISQSWYLRNEGGQKRAIGIYKKQEDNPSIEPAKKATLSDSL